MRVASSSSGSVAGGLLNAQEYVGFLPEAFEVVEVALVFHEDMDDDIAVVDQHPAARRLAFDAMWQAARLFFGCVTDELGQRA